MTVLPPSLLFVAAAVVAAVAPRRVGTAAGVLAGAATAAWALTVDGGATLAVPLWGFDTVPVAVDGLIRPVAFVFGVVAAADALFAHGSGADRRELATVFGYVGASVGAVLAGDWLTLVVHWELMAVAATVLVWRTAAETGPGYRYAVYHQVGGALLLAGVVAHYAATGSFVYADGVVGGLPRLLAVLGVGLNVGFLGLHVWLADAYPAPSVGTSVVLCGFTTKVGVYTLLRVLPDGSLVVAYLGGAMLLFGVTMAILQTEARRLLTYHIVSQVGYMVAAVGVASALAVDGALAHLVNNVLYKSLLFMVAGALVLETGEEQLKKLDVGLGMPATAAAFLVAALAITGTPGFAGFVSKGVVTKAVESAGLDLLWWVLVVGGVGTVVSFAKFGYYAFGRGGTAEADAAPPAQVAGMAVLAVPCVLFGVAPGVGLGVLPGGAASFAPYAPSELLKAGATLAAGAVAFALVRGPLASVPPMPDLDALYHPVGAALRDGTVRATTTVAAGLLSAGRRGLDRGARGLTGPWVAVENPTTLGRGLLLVAVAAAVAVAVLLL